MLTNPVDNPASKAWNLSFVRKLLVMLTQIWADKTFLSLLHDTNKDGKIFNLNHHLE